MKIQVSCDSSNKEETIAVLDQIKDYIDVIEIGKLWWYTGVGVVKEFKERYPGKQYMVDTKLLGPMYRDVEDMNNIYDLGADIVTVSAMMPKEEHVLSAKCAHARGKLLGEDFSCVDNFEERLKIVAEAGADIIYIGTNKKQIELVHQIAPKIQIAAGGGINVDNFAKACECGADVIYAGRGLWQVKDPRQDVMKMRKIADEI